MKRKLMNVNSRDNAADIFDTILFQDRWIDFGLASHTISRVMVWATHNTHNFFKAA